jgi:predicted DNA-binding transcriptional regulator YafY
MSIKNTAYRRYKIIDSMLTNRMRRYPSMDEIREVCFDQLDKYPSVETIQKDIRNMKEEAPDGFEAPIKFNRPKGGYEYTDPNFSINKTGLNDQDINSIKEAIDLLQSIGGSRVSGKFSHAMEKVLSSYREKFPKTDYKRQIIQADTPPPSRGFEHFDLLFTACRDQIPTSIVHYSYRKRKFKAITIHPILLKEFDNKWYVVGYSELHKGMRTFGFDRIYEPHLLYKSFIDVVKEEKDSYMNDVYGVYPLNNEAKQKVIIFAKPLATNYLQAYPIHESQHVQKHDNGSSTITFDLIPSMELIRLFMSYGSEIRVEEPSWIINYIEKSIK